MFTRPGSILKRSRFFIGSALCGTLLAFGLPQAAQAAFSIVVKPGDLAGFSTSNVGTATGDFVSGPATPPSGAGSFRQTLTSSSETTRLRTSRFNGTPLTSISRLTYSTYQSSSTGGQATAIRLSIDLNGDGVSDDTLVFEPAYQHGAYPMVSGASAAPNQCAGVPNCAGVGMWQDWDARSGGWWATSAMTGGPPLDTIAHYASTHQGARLATTTPSLTLQAGSGWTNFDGNVDALNFNGLTFDFELAAPTASNLVVNSDAMGGWAVDDASCGAGPNTGSAGFVRGPVVPPFGLGSARLTTGADGDSVRMLRSSSQAGVRLDQLTSLGYSTFVSSGSSTVAPYLILDVDWDGDNIRDDKLFFEPYYQAAPTTGSGLPDQGSLGLNTWQTWDALNGGWWSENTPTVGPGSDVKTLAYYAGLHPDAKILNPDGNGGLRFQTGCGLPTWNDFDGNVDNVTIGVSGAETTIDFEPVFEVVDCTTSVDDIAAVQSVVDIAPDGYTIKLSGICDFSLAAPHGGTVFSNAATAILIRPGDPINGLTITSDGASQSATVLGSGTQTAFEVAPGNDNVTIRGLKFTNLARPIVVLNTTGTTIGAGNQLPPTHPSGTNIDGNAITGDASMDSAILAIGTSISQTVSYGSATTASSVTLPGGDLIGFTAKGNSVVYTAVGVPDGNKDIVGIDVRHRGGALVNNLLIRNNTVNFGGSNFPSFNINAIRVYSHNPDDSRFINNPTIYFNELGLGPQELNSAGRVGILVRGAAGLNMSANGMRVNISSTGIPQPGGGIVVSDSSGSVSGNFVRLLGDPQTLGTDLGAIGIVDNIGTFFGGTNTGPSTDNILLKNNILRPGTHKAIVLNGVTHVTVTGDCGAQNPCIEGGPATAIGIGEGLTGPGSLTEPGPITIQNPVTEALICSNTFDGGTDDATRFAIDMASGSTDNAFPGGESFTGNTSCTPDVSLDLSVFKSGDDLTVSGSCFPARPVSVKVSDGSANVTHNLTTNFTYSTSFTNAEIEGVLADGPLTVIATFTDDLASGLNVAKTADLTKDTALPAISISTATDPINLANVESVGATGTTEPGASVSVVVSDGLNSTTTSAAAVDGAGQWTATGIDASALSDGPITYTATAEDAAGNTASASSSSAIKDTVGPLANGLAQIVDSDSFVNALETACNPSCLSVNWSNADPSITGASIWFADEDGNIPTECGPTSVAAIGANSLSAACASSLPDGVVGFHAEWFDAANNSATASDSSIKDTVSNVNLNALSAFANASQVGSLTITGTGENGGSVVVSIDDGTTTVTSAPVTVAGGTFSRTLDVSSLSDGNIDVTATAVDVAGNTGSDSSSMTRDTIGPAVAVTSLTDPIGTENQATVSAGGTSELGAAVSVTISDGTLTTAALPAAGTGTTWSAGSFDLTSLANGTVTANATATDAAGNTATASATASKFVEAANPPLVEPESSHRFGTITQDDIDADGKFAILVTHNGPTSTEGYTVTVSEVAAPASGSANTLAVVTSPEQFLSIGETGSFLFDAADFSDGVLDVVVTNSSAAEFESTATLDRTPPAVTVDAPSSQPYFARGYMGLNNLQFSGTATDAASQIIGVVVELKTGTEVRRVFGKFSLGSNSVVWTADFSRSFNRQLTDQTPRTGTITAWSIDRVGNQSAKITSSSFTIL